jgi:hypothetical protein
MIFAREVSDPLTGLVKEIDKATSSNAASHMGSFVVFCSDQKGLEAKLKDLAKREKLKDIVLTIDNPKGPESYKIAKEADVTVVLYDHRKVKANYAFRKGGLGMADIYQIIGDLPKILPDKK